MSLRREVRSIEREEALSRAEYFEIATRRRQRAATLLGITLVVSITSTVLAALLGSL